MSDLLKAVTAIQDNQGPYLEALDQYENTQGEVFASQKLKTLLEKTGMGFRISWAKTVVDTVLNRLEISAVVSTNRGAQERINKMWEENELGVEANDWMRQALTLGDGYVMVWPGIEQGDPEVEMYWSTPLTTRIFYDVENTRRKKYAAQVWEEETVEMVAGVMEIVKRKRANLYYADRIEKYISTVEEPSKDDEWVPFSDSQTVIQNEDGEPEIVDEWPVLNPYGEVPVFHLRTRKQYGRPEHKDAYGVQNALNKLVTTQMATVDFQGFPQRYALTGKKSSGGDFDNDFTEDFTDGEVSPLVDTDDKITAGDGLKSGPGEMWLLRADEVGQFDAADPDAFLKPMAQYIRAMATATATPLHYFEGQGGAPSGESRRVAETPLVKKVLDRQIMFGGTWREIFSFGCKVIDIDPGDITVSWVSPQSQDDLEGWDLVQKKIEAGMPLKMALMEHGYTSEAADAIQNEAVRVAALRESLQQ